MSRNQGNFTEGLFTEFVLSRYRLETHNSIAVEMALRSTGFNTVLLHRTSTTGDLDLLSSVLNNK